MKEVLGRSAADIDATLQRERDRIVVTLRALADTIATTPIPRLSGGLAWMATATDALVRTVQRALGARP